MAGLVQRMDVVIHAAGLAHQFGVRAQPRDYMDVNGAAVAELMEAAVAGGVQHFVLISSVSVYGPGRPGEYAEHQDCHPEGPYAVSKYYGEQLATRIAQQSGMQLTILRPATVYGEEDPGNVARLMRRIDHHRFFWIGTGSNCKSLIHRDDVARACEMVVRTPIPGTNVFNVSAPAYAMREVVAELADALERRIPRWHMPATPALRASHALAQTTRGRRSTGELYSMVRKWLEDDVYDITKFCRAYDFQPSVTLKEGIRREVAWYRSRPQ